MKWKRQKKNHEKQSKIILPEDVIEENSYKEPTNHQAG
jgi:hypothetical protein